MIKNNFYTNASYAWCNLSPRRKYQLIFLLFLIILTSIFEVFSIATVIPFLTVVSDPNSFVATSYFQTLNKYIGPINERHLSITFGALFCISVLISGILRYLLLVIQTNITYGIGIDFSVKIFSNILYQPYSKHIARNSSEIIAAISIKSNELIVSLLYPMVIALGAGIILTSVFSLLLYLDPEITISVTFIFLFFYICISFISRKVLGDSGETVAREYGNVIKIIQESLGGIRDVLLDGSQKIFIDNYFRSEKKLRNSKAKLQIVSGTPRYIIETMGTILIILLALILTEDNVGQAALIPTIGIIALASQRLIPLMQQLYTSWASIRGGSMSVADALLLLRDQDMLLKTEHNDHDRLPFKTSIEFRNVKFHYNTKSSEVLSGVNLIISKGARIGIVGKTGCGKSTFLDLLLGLLKPTSGGIYIDGVYLDDKTISNWQACIAHVPQTIYLADASIAENIAFSVHPSNIDRTKLVVAARVAQIDDYIMSLPGAYETRVGERGLNLSGGQRQRLGIARAIYKETKIIIFDEATSALDDETEQAIMDEIYKLSKDITLVIVAHRFSTLKKCTMVYRIKDKVIDVLGNESTH